MTSRNDDIENNINLPRAITDAGTAYVEDQDAARGDWENFRGVDQPNFPWPDSNNPVLRMLVQKFIASVDGGMDPTSAALSLAVHCWFEGSIAGYDRGRAVAADTK